MTVDPERQVTFPRSGRLARDVSLRLLGVDTETADKPLTSGPVLSRKDGSGMPSSRHEGSPRDARGSLRVSE